MRLEDQIITALIHDQIITRKILPFTKLEYFAERNDQIIIEEIQKYYQKYNKSPSTEILEIEVSNRTDISGEEAVDIPKQIQEISDKVQDSEWLITETEKFYKNRAIYLSVIDSITIIEGHDKNRTKDVIPHLLQEALSVCFDSSIGHDYFEDAEERFEFYNMKEDGIPFDLKLMNKITGDVGMRKKSLSCLASKTGGGKSIFMCHVAASTLLQGKNVLYITLEMGEKKIAERIDANLFDIPINNLKHEEHKSFIGKVSKLNQKTKGRLVIKEYPTGGAHAGHFRALIEDLKNKKSFKPDLIIIDYLNICASQRVRNNNANSYTIVKSIAEELRSLMIEYDVPGLTATQVTRAGQDSSELTAGDISESIGLLHTVDFFFALIRTEELDELGQVMICQIKNRYGDVNFYKKFLLGLDLPKMKFYDLEQTAQKGLSDAGKQDDDDVPLFDKSKFGKRIISDGFQFE